MPKDLSIREFEPTLTATYSTVVPKGEDVFCKSMVIRNTLTERVVMRIAGDDDQTMTIEAGEKIVLDGLSKIRGQLIEMKTETSQPNTLRLNLFN